MLQNLKDTYFMIFLQPEEQLALKYILKNWVMGVLANQDYHPAFTSQILDMYLDLAKDLDGQEADSFVLPMMRTAIFRSAFETFYWQRIDLSVDHMKIAGKHYEMLAKWFFEEKVAMTKDEVLNLGSHFDIL